MRKEDPRYVTSGTFENLTNVLMKLKEHGFRWRGWKYEWMPAEEGLFVLSVVFVRLFKLPTIFGTSFPQLPEVTRPIEDFDMTLCLAGLYIESFVNLEIITGLATMKLKVRKQANFDHTIFSKNITGI